MCAITRENYFCGHFNEYTALCNPSIGDISDCPDIIHVDGFSTQPCSSCQLGPSYGAPLSADISGQHPTNLVARDFFAICGHYTNFKQLAVPKDPDGSGFITFERGGYCDVCLEMAQYRRREGRAIGSWLESTLRENGAISRLRDGLSRITVTDPEASRTELPKDDFINGRKCGLTEGLISLPTIPEETEDVGEGPPTRVISNDANEIYDERYRSMRTWSVRHEDEVDDSLFRDKRVLPPLPPYY